MRDYWLTQDLLKAAGFGFLALAALGVVLALWLPKKWWQKGIALAAVFLLISIPVRQGVKEVAQEQKAVDDHKERYAKAKALFDERCKTAGEKIYKTVDGVDGLMLMKVRPEGINRSDQYSKDDPYGRDLGANGYILFMLAGKDDEGKPSNSIRRGAIYQFVVAKDPQDGKFYRYTLSPETPKSGDIALIKQPIQAQKLPRYGVTFDDISTKEERDYWIAGSSLKVIDLKTQEVLAERVGYMFDAGQGNQNGGRSPWLYAAHNACPAFPSLHGTYPKQTGQTRLFVEKVLRFSQSSQGEK
jgi:hypothetical protein